MTSTTLWSAFEAVARRDPSRIAVFARAESWSYGALNARALDIAEQFRGLDPGAIAIRNADKVAALAGFLAAMSATRPAAVLDPSLGGMQTERYLEALAPVAVATPDGLVARPCPQPVQSDEFYFGFSSGTTGAPKAFARTHESWLASFDACEAVVPFSGDDTVALPGGLHNSLFLFGAIHALCRGAAIVPSGLRGVNAALRRFRAANATLLYGVPAMLQEFLYAEFKDFAPRAILCGGAKVKEELRRHIEARLPGTDLVEFYGASELSFVSYASTTRPAPPNSVGCPFPQVQIAAFDDDRQPLPAGQTGLIGIHSPMVFSRYLRAGTRARVPEGWHTAGDMGYLDARGFLYLQGRSNRVLNVSGAKVFPETIEACLESEADVQTAAVIGVPDETRGERIAAIVQARGPLSRRRLARRCRDELGSQFVPHDFYVAQALPRTPTGKISVHEVAAMVARRDPAFVMMRND